MTFAGINYWAVAAAALASWLFGALWYGLLSRQWLAAQGVTQQDFHAGGRSPNPFVISFVAQLVMAWALAGLIGHLFAKEAINLKSGALTGAWVWLGFVLTVISTAYAYQRKTLPLLLIDGGYWLAVLVIQGIILGLLGPG